MTAAIQKIQSQLEERLLAASNAFVSQMHKQVRAIKEEAHATDLASCLQLIKTLLQEVHLSLKDSRAPPSADGPGDPLALVALLVLMGPLGPPGPPKMFTSSSGKHSDLLHLSNINLISSATCV